MKIQYVSDLHLDSASMSPVVKNGDVLVVAGDVSFDDDLLVSFFERKAPDDLPIIFVPGNHEHECKDSLRSLEHFSGLLSHLPHVQVLQNTSVVIDDVEFVGATLWSDFEGEGLERKAGLMEWAARINDFKTIGYGKRAIRPEDMAQLSKYSQQAIEQLLDKSVASKKVVVSHFAPHPLSVDVRYQAQRNGGYWFNELPALMSKADLWVHGHVHGSKDYVAHGTRVVCNPRGYSAQFDLAENLEFDPRSFVEV